MTTAPPCTIFLFGATGDLTKQKLIPALLLMQKNGELHPDTRVIAIARKAHTDESIRHELSEFIIDASQKALWHAFSGRVTYHHLEFDDAKAYDALKAKVDQLPESIRDNRMFYLATPQTAFGIITEHLSRTGIAVRKPKTGWHRVVFEKPFGSDLKSAQKLNNDVTKLFAEEQIYRIDHYLGKSFVQEILALRFANTLFEPLWNREYVDSVRITIAEEGGVGSRAGYYDNAGAVRDILQNHLLQLLSLVTMDRPLTMDPEDIRDAKVEVLGNVTIDKKDIVVGQYATYRQEAGVRPDSQTETYVLAKLYVSNRRWWRVPFFLVTGKGLKSRYAEIVVTFKSPCDLFQNATLCPPDNMLVIRIQPEEGIKIVFNLADGAKDGGITQHLMNFCHDVNAHNTKEAYELLIGDVMLGDQTLFTRWDFVARSWKITDALRAHMAAPHSYVVGSEGPDAALAMMKQDPKYHMQSLPPDEDAPHAPGKATAKKAPGPRQKKPQKSKKKKQ